MCAGPRAPRRPVALARAAGGPLSWRESMVVMGVVVAGLWVVELVSLAGHVDLVQYGIVPRDPAHLTGILVAPFVHLSVGHLAGNTIPLAVFGWIALTGNGMRFAVTTAVVVLVSGLGVWVTAQSGTVTVGSSGVVFGWCGYLLLRGALDWRHRIGGWALLVVVVSMGWGLVPARSGVSWQGHLFGFLGGLLAAGALTRRVRRPAPPPSGAHPVARHTARPLSADTRTLGADE